MDIYGGEGVSTSVFFSNSKVLGVKIIKKYDNIKLFQKCYTVNWENSQEAWKKNEENYYSFN